MPHRVLVVDCNAEALAGDQSILAEAGYLVTCTANFAEAKQRLLLAPPDLLMTDVRLGEYNGLHLVLRGHLSHPEMPAIVRAEDRDSVLEEEARRADALYLIKPVDAATLVDSVRRLLAGRPSDPGTEANRRWPRKRSGVAVSLDDSEATVVDLSYGGLRVEIPQDEGEIGRADRVNVPNLGSIPVRLVWSKRGGYRGAWWCGLEILATDERAAEAWHSYVDSFPDR
jgi:DNA-binding response OmpR family regulator